LIAGVGVVLLRFQLTDRMARGLEMGVGIMLVLLGINVLRTLHQGASESHDHTAASHSDGNVWFMSRPLVIGMVHGLAGSASLLLLALTAVSSSAAFAYIAVFGVGSIAGMAMMSLLVGASAQLTMQFGNAALAVRGLSGSLSVALGLFIVYENAVLNRPVV